MTTIETQDLPVGLCEAAERERREYQFASDLHRAVIGL
jgi:hypothetical protein